MSSVCNEKSVSPSTGKHIYKSCLEGTCGVQPVMGSDPSILENLTVTKVKVHFMNLLVKLASTVLQVAKQSQNEDVHVMEQI